MPLSPDFRLVKKADAALIFGVCLKTVDNYIEAGLLPQPVAFGSRDYWHPDDFEAFIAQTFRRRNESLDAKSASEAPPHSPDTSDLPADVPSGHRAYRCGRAQPAAKGHPSSRARARQQAVLEQLNRGAQKGSPPTQPHP
jgi:hypothetical protein